MTLSTPHTVFAAELSIVAHFDSGETSVTLDAYNAAVETLIDTGIDPTELELI